MKDAGVEPKMADAIVETLEDMLGEPLTKDVFEERAEAIKTKLDAMILRRQIWITMTVIVGFLGVMAKLSNLF